MSRARPNAAWRDAYRAAADCLALSAPVAKCEAVDRLWSELEADRLEFDSRARLPDDAAPGRPDRPELVPPSRVPRRRLGSAAGRAALVHAIAHIEFNAINLALDAACRFRDMPPGFARDWLSVAADEARHFRLLERRLADLGHAYGDFPAHDGLWEMARRTTDSCLHRMALVPRVLEARGLDVTPGMIRRLRQTGDGETAAILELILEEEVRHVAIGTHWFHYCCAQQGLDPARTFLDLLAAHFSDGIHGPFNLPARYRAGFSPEEMEALS